MKQYQLRVEVEEMEDGAYFAICPDLQGCHAEGETLADAIANVEDVARVIIELCQEKGLPLPPELKGESPKVLRAEVVVKVGA